MGYPKVVLIASTAYSDDQLVQFVKEQRPFSVSIPTRRALGSLPNKLNPYTLTYAYVVNSFPLEGKLLNNGVYGIYTDVLLSN